MAGVGGHLYPGKPAANGEGPTIHLVAEGRLEDTMDRVKDAGGQVVSPPITIPPGRFFYASRSLREFDRLLRGALMRRADRLFQIVQHLRSGGS